MQYFLKEKFNLEPTLQAISILQLPSYAQELNPVERFFGEMRKVTANKIFNDIDEMEKLLYSEVKIWK